MMQCDFSFHVYGEAQGGKTGRREREGGREALEACPCEFK